MGDRSEVRPIPSTLLGLVGKEVFASGGADHGVVGGVRYVLEDWDGGAGIVGQGVEEAGFGGELFENGGRSVGGCWQHRRVPRTCPKGFGAGRRFLRLWEC